MAQTPDNRPSESPSEGLNTSEQTWKVRRYAAILQYIAKHPGQSPYKFKSTVYGFEDGPLTPNAQEFVDKTLAEAMDDQELQTTLQRLLFTNPYQDRK